MPGPKFEFTKVTKFEPETFGEPGNRTFRINADSASSSAKIWLEKEQLTELCLAMVQMEKENQIAANSPDESSLGTEAEGLTNLDFKTNQLSFGHIPETNYFVVDAHDPNEDNLESPTVRIWVTREMISPFSNKGLEIVSAGRRICQLCGRPMNVEGHYCERSNGHSKESAAHL
jgi:uncharacterized repeat protein (TIGR03847 family)